jgi:uncharacterized protein
MSHSTYTLITGASGGLGECFARSLAAQHHRVVLVARSREKLEALASELRAAHGVAAEALPFDLSLPGAAAQLVSALRPRGIEVDLLVNNAGFGARGEFWELARDRQTQMLRLNVETLMELTHLLAGPMVARRCGGIINVSSTAGFQPIPWTSVYAATKAFVTSFSLGLAEELRPHGVTVVTLCPGGTQTNFFEASQYGQRTLPGGLQAPEEVVAAALESLDRGGGLVVPRLLNKLTVFVQRFVPRGLVMKATAELFRPVKHSR